MTNITKDLGEIADNTYNRQAMEITMTKQMQQLLIKLANTDGSIWLKAKGQIESAKKLEKLGLVSTCPTYEGFRVSKIVLFEV